MKWGIFILEKTENLDVCPFCHIDLPQGPAYFCPACGEKLDEEFSKRQIIFESEEETPIYENHSPEDEIEDEEEEDFSDFDDYDSLLNNDLSGGDLSYYDEDEEEDFSDFDDYDSLFNHDSMDSQNSDLDEEKGLDDNSKTTVYELSPENELSKLNKSIKLDLWLEKCVDKKFAEDFLKHKSLELNEDDLITSKIISNFELEELIAFKYASRNFDLIPILKSLFLPLGVISIVDAAKKHGVVVSLTKDGLIKNFLKKYSPHKLIILLNKEGFDIFRYLDISALEQIYLLDDDELEDLSKGACFNLNGSNYKMISCVLKHYEDGFLISHNKYDRGYNL